MSKDFDNEYDNQDVENTDEQFEDEYETEDFREIILTLDDNTQLKCLVISEFEVEEQGYVALLPVHEEEEEEKVDILLYRANFNDDDTFDISMIESKEEFEIASEAYYQSVGISDEDFMHDDCDCDDCGSEVESE